MTLAQAPANPILALVEDDSDVRRMLQLMLHSGGFEVRSHASADTLLGDPMIGQAVCLVADYGLGSSNGIRVLRALRQSGRSLPAVLITGSNPVGLLDEAKAAGFAAVLSKPVPMDVLLGTVRRVIHEEQAQRLPVDV